MDSYDNDWLFLDDDLFCVWVDEYASGVDVMQNSPKYSNVLLGGEDDGVCVLQP